MQASENLIFSITKYTFGCINIRKNIGAVTMDTDQRTELVLFIADDLNASIDEVWQAVRHLDESRLIALSEQPSSLPLYMKSSESP